VLQLDNPAQWSGRIGVSVVPTTILVDQSGSVLSFNAGILTPAALDSVQHALVRAGESTKP
jgi:hypothetical protein